LKVNIGKFPKKFDAQRKVSVQIDDFDTWSLDHTLALIIHPALVKFKQDSLETGHPCLGIDMDMCTSGSCDCNTTWASKRRIGIIWKVLFGIMDLRRFYACIE